METTVEYDATKTLTELLKRVAQGERITITEDGVPVAVMAPPEAGRKLTVEEAIADIEKLRKGLTLGPGLTIRDLIEEGRR